MGRHGEPGFRLLDPLSHQSFPAQLSVSPEEFPILTFTFCSRSTMNGFWRKKTWLFLPTWLRQQCTPSPPWSLWGWMPPTSGPTSWWSCTTSAPPSLSQTFSLLKSLPNFWCLIHWRAAALCFLWILFHHPICVHDCSLHYLLNPLWVLKRCV